MSRGYVYRLEHTVTCRETLSAVLFTGGRWDADYVCALGRHTQGDCVRWGVTWFIHRRENRWLHDKITKLRGLSPQANYSDRATAIVGDVSANFCGYSVLGGQLDGSLRPYSQFSRPESLLFLPSSSSVVLTRLSGPRSRPTTSQKIW
jgi:hypothetical protein